LAVTPESLRGEVPPGQIFRQREGCRRHPAHLVPVGDPAAGLLGPGDRDGPPRAAALANSTPEPLATPDPAEDAIDVGQSTDGPGAGCRHAVPAEEHAEVVLVLASLDDGPPGKKEAAGTPSPPPGDGEHVAIAVGNQQI